MPNAPLPFTTLRIHLLMGFCAVALTASRALMRLHLGVTGHAMLVTIFFLLIARGSVRRFGAAAYTGLLAGCLMAVFGVHRSGMTIIPQMVLTGLLLDCAALLPAVLDRWPAGAAAGGLAGTSRGLTKLIAALLAGMDPSTALIKAGMSALWNGLFGALGGAAAPVALKRLRAFGVIQPAPEKTDTNR